MIADLNHKRIHSGTTGRNIICTAQPANLFEPYPGGELGAHGRFSDKARAKENIIEKKPMLSLAATDGFVGAAVVGSIALKGLIGSYSQKGQEGKAITHGAAKTRKLLPSRHR